LVQNVRERGLIELLFQALDRGQVAPVGYLLLTKITVLLFGESEFAFRLVPFLASVVALALFWLLARRLLGPAGALVATTGR